MSTGLRKGSRPPARALELRCEYATEPLRLGVGRPRFSWNIETSARAWRLEGESITIDAAVPPNTTATVRLPGREESFDVGSGRHQWAYDVDSDLASAWLACA